MNWYARDGEPNHLPMHPQPLLTDLPERSLLGKLHQTAIVPATPALVKPRQQELPLDGNVVLFN